METLERIATNRRRRGSLATTLLLLPAPLLLTGCASLSQTEKGAAAGAGAGGVIGGIIGNQTGSTARGAIIGAAIGGAAGAYIGNRMDRTAEELEESLTGAEVERVGEGILVTFDSGILFDFDSSDLRYVAQRELSDLAESLQEFPDTDVLIVGHTDSVGDPGYNRGLSERRAQAAARHLAREGLAEARLVVEGRGEGEPVASNEDEAGRQENRRVEIAIFASEDYRKQVKDRFGGGTP